MSNGAILYIEGKNNPNVNKILHYSDGTVEVRTPDWKQVLEVYNIGREATMLDMEDQFLKIYEDATPKDKAKKLRQMAKALAKEAGDIIQIAAIEAEEKEAAEKAAKDAKAAKARKRKASEKRSATLFKDETEASDKETLEAKENATGLEKNNSILSSVGSRYAESQADNDDEANGSYSIEVSFAEKAEDAEDDSLIDSGDTSEEDPVIDSEDDEGDDEDEEISA